MTGEQLITALMFALMNVLLLSLLIARRGELSTRKALTCVAYTTSQLIVRLFDYSDDRLAYLYMALLLLLDVCFIHAISEWNWKVSFQRGLCYFLLTDCIVQVLCHVSQRLFGLDIFRTLPLIRQIPSIMLMGMVQWVLLQLIWRFFPPENCVDMNSLAFSLMASIPYLFASHITFWLPIEHESVPNSLILTMMFSCFLALALIISLEARLWAEEEKRRIEAQRHVMELQQQQYIMRRSEIETVRRQYHDMKNLLLYLGSKTSTENVKAHVNKILSDIHPFETVLDTGNEVIDILLGEKLAACQNKGIPCTIIVDGTMLSFINPLDLVTILGNAMDNAIEACERIQPEARYIQVRSTQTEGFAMLRFYNSHDGRPVETNGPIQTQKQDRENHGFGLPNIQRVAAQYGGEVNWRVESDEFVLTLLFPKSAQ